jgi:F-type H+-transporting ATPase subunit a
MPLFGPVGLIEPDGSFVPLFRPANTDINLTLSIAIMSFVFVETWGMRASGTLPYLGQFFNVGQIGRGIKQLFKGKIRPALGNVGLGFINLFVGLLELLSHFIRIISFTFRLFGNMVAGEILLLIVAFLIPLVAIIPFYGLELLVGFIQALIFAGLTLVFGIIAVAPMHEGEEQ